MVLIAGVLVYLPWRSFIGTNQLDKVIIEILKVHGRTIISSEVGLKLESWRQLSDVSHCDGLRSGLVLLLIETRLFSY